LKAALQIMAFMAKHISLLAALAITSSAFRVRPKKRSERASLLHDSAKKEATSSQAEGPSIMVGPAKDTTTKSGDPGQVDFTYNFGAPGGGSPALQNQRGQDPCFPGLRVWQTEPGRWWGKWLDVVARIGNAVSYWHAWMPSMEMDTKSNNIWNFPCNLERTKKPSDAFSTSINLHDAGLYVDQLHGSLSDPWYQNMSVFAGRKSYWHDVQDVYREVKQFGWGLVGSGLHQGGTVYGGKQVAHLIQHPTTLECTLTFQGTTSLQGWMENFNVGAEPFCGLTYPGERCGSLFTCSTRRPRGSFVHGGFKDRVMAMVKHPEFQQNILPHLPSCSRVYAVGHSLGGAVAELFAACTSNAPKEGEHGWEDYKWMAWTKAAPARLSYIE